MYIFPINTNIYSIFRLNAVKGSDKYLIVLSVSLFAISTYMFPSLLPLTYSQSSNEGSPLQNNFLTYYNPFTMVKIQYPSFWEASEFPDNKIVSFVSPLETTAVIVHNMPTPSKSADEVLTNMLLKIKNNLSNVIITNTSISDSDDGSAIQTLTFTYGNDSNPNIYKVFQVLKTNKDETYVFTYHSTESLFDRFFPLASQMYNSYQVPSFDNVFPSDVYSIDSVNTGDSAE